MGRKLAAVLLIVVLVAGGYWYGSGGASAPSGFVEIEVPPTRFLEVTRSGNGDWAPFVEPLTGFTGFRLSKGVSRQVTVRMHDLNEQGETRSEYDVAPGGYVVTGNQRIRICMGAT